MKANREEILKWFLLDHEPRYPYPSILGAGISLFVGIVLMANDNFSGGVTLFIIGMFWGLIAYVLYKKALYEYNSRISDNQIDLLMERDLKKIEKKVLEKIGIDPSELVSESLVITGPILEDDEDDSDRENLVQKGEDNIVRYTPIALNLLHFTQNQLIIYSCNYDFYLGEIYDENTEEYYYKDIVSVSTKSRSDIGQLNDEFTLITTGGTSFSMVLNDPSLIERTGGGVISTTHAERAVQVIRKMIREKKS